MRTISFTAAIAASALMAGAPAHAQLRAHAGVVAGTAQFGSQFQCATSGPAIGSPWFAGLTLPTEGIAACGLSGQVDDKVGSAAPLTATAASGPMSGPGAFTGAARARADYWSLGASADATAAGSVSPGVYHEAAAYASFADDLTFTSASVPNGTAGRAHFSFLVEGMMKNLPVAPYVQQGDVALSILVGGVRWDAFRGTTTGAALPYVRGGATGLPGSFVLSPGAFQGSANITTSAGFGFVWGAPMHVEVALYTSVWPCCAGASIASDFYDSAVLTGIDAYASGWRVGDFAVRASSGALVGAGGLAAAPATAVPEPAPLGSTLLGLGGGAVGWSARRRRRGARPGACGRPGTALAGRYAIEREIGRGGAATVYLARDLRHARHVAVKVLDPGSAVALGAERFLDEIRVTARLQHPNLLPLFDSGEAGGVPYYVMPYVEGESLRARLEREGALPVDEAVRIAAAVADALDYAHARGVIHRDLKPENILLEHGQPVVADFGIALAVGAAGGGGARATQAGLSLGTPQYMSPEQATGDEPLDARTDVYSLGAVTYEMLTGEPPHAGATAQAVVARVVTAEPRPVRRLRPSVPPHVARAVERSLAKLPEDRFDTPRQLAAALRAPPGEAAGVRAAVRRWRRVAAAAGAAAMLTCAAAAWATLAGRGAPAAGCAPAPAGR